MLKICSTDVRRLEVFLLSIELKSWSSSSTALTSTSNYQQFPGYEYILITFTASMPCILREDAKRLIFDTMDLQSPDHQVRTQQAEKTYLLEKSSIWI